MNPIRLDVYIMFEIDMKSDRNQLITNPSKSQVTALKMIRERERLFHMLGIEYESRIKSEKRTTTTLVSPSENSYHGNSRIEGQNISDIVDGVEISANECKSSMVHMALEYILSEMERGREPTPEQVAQHVGMKSRPLGTQLSKLGIKSMATRRGGQGMRIYPMSMSPRIKEILRC